MYASKGNRVTQQRLLVTIRDKHVATMRIPASSKSILTPTTRTACVVR
ncbi:hypothetical protein RB5150 [Rhodopirellula baltica SH 1]|uniref:Uncharacterized protein n=1 Tax=Rhodopirellula baltica (strain DSM 10527 / NCIMB 13988 / SH1) TaxID=243090 RepID=Q7UGL2_RHOBA|nr:hypothetical protein RB5150 [Rhodopirellula baltica SH 1]